MPLAQFKALCMDALHPDEMARFWAGVLGLHVENPAPDGAVLRGPTPQHTVWINHVPERQSVKRRVHLDVHAASDTLPGANAISEVGEFPWRVLADPEGGEFCVFTREEVPDYRLYEVVVDCADADRQASWWQGVLGGKTGASDQGYTWLEEVPGMPFESLVFVPVPEPKAVKNSVHWDVTVTDPAIVDRLAADGGRIIRTPDDEISWTVMADPEGNEFCVFVA